MIRSSRSVKPPERIDADVSHGDKMRFQAGFVGASLEIVDCLPIVLDVAQAGQVQKPIDPHRPKRVDENFMKLCKLIAVSWNKTGRNGLLEPHPLKDRRLIESRRGIGIVL